MARNIPGMLLEGLESLLGDFQDVDRRVIDTTRIEDLSVNEDAAEILHASDDPSAVLELASKRAHRVDCRDCGKWFKERKTLCRHQRTVHKARNFSYFHCDRHFKRQDILIRHMQSQHEAKDTRTNCGFCGKKVRPRSLATHIKHCPKQPTDLYTDWLQAAHAESPATVVAQNDAHLYLPPHLAEPPDPIMIGVSLFVQFEPWGEYHRWLKNHITPDPDMYTKSLPHEVRKLRSLLDRQLAEVLPQNYIDGDSSLPDVLAIFCVFVGQTQGWDPAMRYCKALVKLAIMQIVAFGPEPQEFLQPSAAAVEVFTTILLRNVPARVASTCQIFMVQMLTLLRLAAVNTAWLAFGHPEAPIIESAEQWHYRWRPRLREIADSACTVPKGVPSRIVA
ncbi:Putative Zinc finger C2H2-type [Septoria linicola]|uniref:Zinc finger C2H2-type n=1 Tax=Septoria linicola TaxID=215465 RepID=A0A9Q9ANK9_9PEZI|nr:Putative Zinc finger C2H2-type [Septoria linicola]